MKIQSNLSSFTTWLLSGTLLFLAGAMRVSATNASEGADFSNGAPGTTYTLTSGANTFSGTVTTTADGRDYFSVTVPAGLQINSVSKTVSGGSFSGFVSFNNETIGGEGTASFTGQFATPYPLPAGTYQAYVNADFSTGTSWSVVVTVGAAPNYTVTTSGGSITLTSLFGTNDTISITNPVANNLLFSIPGRLISVNGGANRNGDSGNLSLSGINSITVNGVAGTNTINVSAFSGSTFPSLSIYAGSGHNAVNFNGSITFAPNNYLDVELQNNKPSNNVVIVTPNVNLVTSGTGTISVFCSKNISLGSGSSLVVQNGDIDVEANQQTISATGNFVGVNLDGATIKSTGSGIVTVNGTGGNDAGGYQLGVQVINGGKIMGGNNYVFVTGNGGASTNIVNRGVTVYGAGSAITSANGSVYVTGRAGAVGSYFGIGVSILFGAEISAGGLGLVTVIGNGYGAVGSGYNMGIEMGGTGSRIYSNGRTVAVNANAGPGASYGLYMADSAAVYTPAAGGSVEFYIDTLSLDNTVSITTTNGGSHVRFKAASPSTKIDLGGANDSHTLGISVPEIFHLNTANVEFYNPSGSIVTSQPIINLIATNMTFLTAPTGFIPATTNADIVLPNGTVNIIQSSPLTCAINGPAPGTNYDQLTVLGGVNLTGSALALTGSYAGAVGDSFTIVDNLGTNNPTVGTFDGLPENALVFLNGQPARIHYAGGDGNDVTVQRIAPGVFLSGGLAGTNWQLAASSSYVSNGFSVQATTNFITWTNLGRATSDYAGKLTFTDTNAFRFKYRFYRTTN